MSVATALDISLEVACDEPECSELAFPLLKQLRKGYDLCSVMEIPKSMHEWREAQRTARKRADRAERRGYCTATFERWEWEDDIYEINTSAERRQGRPMAASYRQRQEFSPLPDYLCPRHAIRTTGVFTESSQLVAYLVMYRAGELALVSQILGHADHLENEVMYLLFSEALKREMLDGCGFCVYNRHDSGTDGLRFFKDRLGFEPMEVAWLA